MKEELMALEQNGTQGIVVLPVEKKVVKCQCVYTVKLNPDGSLARLKTYFVANGYSQVYGIDYQDTSPGYKVDICADSYFLVATHYWPLHQLC